MQEYTVVPCHTSDAYENEILQWQRNGWLLPYSKEELGLPKSLIPLMAVVQEQKQKVRLVLDYLELNFRLILLLFLGKLLACLEYLSAIQEASGETFLLANFSSLYSWSSNSY